MDFRTANVDFTRFSLLCDDALVLMGKLYVTALREDKMKDILAIYRRWVVWQIFSTQETKETKSEGAHLNFTDYTSSTYKHRSTRISET